MTKLTKLLLSILIIAISAGVIFTLNAKQDSSEEAIDSESIEAELETNTEDTKATDYNSSRSNRTTSSSLIDSDNDEDADEETESSETVDPEAGLEVEAELETNTEDTKATDYNSSRSNKNF